MSLPTIKAIGRIYRAPNGCSKISILTKSYLSKLYVRLVDEVIPYEVETIPNHPTPNLATIARLAKLSKVIKNKHFDIAIILPRSFSSALLTYLARIPRRIGYASSGRSIFLTDPIPRTKDILNVHRVRYFYHILTKLGAPPPLEKPEIVIDNQSEEWARKELKVLGINGKTAVGFNPTAAYGTAKMWNAIRFVDLGKKLVKKYNVKIMIFGAPNDYKVCQDIAERIDVARIGTAYNYAGKTDVLQLSALIKNCSIFVTNDTGPMHIADAVNTPIVAIFGPTNPITTGPFGKEGIVLKVPECSCSPCLKRTCPYGHHKCMELITCEEVFSATCRLLDGKFAA